ncbi:MAG TPA: hypothetical protein VJ949_10275 [Cryomorphaceae bacterium]|nr:hypothetical protein [Cryomorphaceae bacterium]
MKLLNQNKSRTSLTATLLLALGFGFCTVACGQSVSVKSAPISNSKFDKAIRKFNKRYQLNAGKIEEAPLKIKIDETVAMILTGQTDSAGRGLVFHYLIDTISKEIHYAVTAGIQDTGNLGFIPKEFNADENGVSFPHYFILKNSGDLEIHEFKDSLNLKPHYEKYRRNVERRSWTFIWRDTENMKKHPRMVFHQGEELDAFYRQWRDDEDGDLYLYIFNGMDKTPDGKWFFKVRNYNVPVLRIGNEDGPFALDDTPYENDETVGAGNAAKDLKIKYKAKALDAGHVCPPHCASSVYIPRY